MSEAITITTGTRQPSAHTVWITFRAMFPNSSQPFTDDPAKVEAWRYAIRQKQAATVYSTIAVDNSELLAIRQIYAVKDFDGMPKYQQDVYLKIAVCYPGFQVYACGSRVRGDYVECFYPGDHIVIQARKKAGLRARVQSDYDFWVEPAAIQVGELPPDADRCRLRIPDNEKVKVPICRG